MSDVNWPAQTLVLTGASGGLGQALAEQLSRRGARLLLVARSTEQLSALATRLKQTAVAADLATEAGRQRLQECVQALSTPLTGLINNAAVTHEGLFADATAEDIEAVIETNLKMPLLLTHQLLPQLRTNHGWVMNIGSVFGALGFPGQSLYCASKFGLRGFSEALQRELMADDVTLLYCAPRAIRTHLNKGLINRLNQRLKTAQDSPQWVAAQVIQQIEQQQHSQTLGWPEKAFARINGLWPEQVARSLRRARQTLYKLLEDNPS